MRTQNTRHLLWLLAVGALLTLPLSKAQALGTPANTVISNTATASYSDGTNTYTSTSQTVTVTVAQVSGLTITPVDTTPSLANVTNGETGVVYTFTITNTGNFTDNIFFQADNGAGTPSGSIQATNATVTAATIQGGASLFGNAAGVTSAAVPANSTITVLVTATITGTNGQVATVTLGDATGENQPATDDTTHEVRTVATTSVNGQRAAKGDQEAGIVVDGELQVTLIAPPGPITLGNNITYSVQDLNPGNEPVTTITLGGTTGIFIIAPIPVNTTLATGQPFPAGTLYTTSPLTTGPLAATWTTTPPGNLATVTRIAFNMGTTLAAGASTASQSYQVTVPTTDNASVPIDEIVDTFGTNLAGAQVADQSGDTTPDRSDGNANFTEPVQPATSTTSGVQQVTTLAVVGSVLNGPNGQPGAVGPTSNNDDYTNLGFNVGLGTGLYNGTTTSAQTVTFTNSVQNTGNGNDTYALTLPNALAANVTSVQISVNGGATYTTMVGSSGNSVNLPVNFGQTANYLVKVTIAAGAPLYTAASTTIKATSTATPGSSNNTIDNVYPGFLKITKTYSVSNTTGVGTATQAVPGAVITWTITYQNVAETGGTNDPILNAQGPVVITENGTAGTNNWGTYTTYVLNSATDSTTGVIGGNAANSTLLTDTITSVAPGVTGTFTFKTTIN